MKSFSCKTASLAVLTATLLVFLSSLVFLPAFEAKAAAVITETVDISTTRQAESGEGYVWSNRNKTMTFTNLRLETEDDYGFLFPANATLILNGNNVISAKLVALAAKENLKIRGKGTLTLIAETGLKMVSPGLTYSLTLAEGTVKIQAKTCGIKSEYPTVVVGNTKLSISLSDAENGRAIDAYSVMLNNGTFTANATIHSNNNLSCGGCKLTVHSPNVALSAKEIVIGEGNKIKVGASEADLSSADQYDGEASLVLDPTRSQKKSLILGDRFAVYWDYIILISVAILLSASIALPIVFKVRKERKKRAEIEARRAATAAAKKEAAKAARRAKYAGKKQE